MYSLGFVSDVIEDGSLRWHEKRHARVDEKRFYEVLTDQYLFPNDPPDEHAILSGPDSLTAYHGRAVVSEFPDLVPLVRMVAGQSKVGKLAWYCTCGDMFLSTITEGKTHTIVRRICEQFDDHVGRCATPVTVDS